MKFHIHTYGCQMNVRDSEAVEALLVAAGHEKVAGEEDAELVVVNSCTVRQKAEEKAVGKAGNLIAARKLTGLMGCAVKRMGPDVFKRLPKLDFAVGPRALGLIPRIVEEGRFPRLELGEDLVPDCLAAHVEGGWQAFVTVLLGCDNRCSYCIVPDVRGHEYSRPAREVVAEVAALAKRGVKEVCLLGQSVLRYGVRNAAWDEKDAPSPGGYAEPFPRLLEALAAIPGIGRIRFTSAHPKGCTDELRRADPARARHARAHGRSHQHRRTCRGAPPRGLRRSRRRASLRPPQLRGEVYLPIHLRRLPEKMNDASSIILIGIGGAGSAMARGVSRAFGDGLRYLLIDTDATTGQEGEPFVLLGGERLAGRGSGGDIVTARLAAEDSIDALDEALEDVRLAVVVTALGGGTGGGATLEAVKHLSKRGIPAVVFATTPFTRRQPASSLPRCGHWAPNLGPK